MRTKPTVEWSVWDVREQQRTTMQGCNINSIRFQLMARWFVGESETHLRFRISRVRKDQTSELPTGDCLVK